MASFDYQHSILYKGENPATATFVPKNQQRAQQKTLRHRAGAEPAFLRKELEEQEQKREEERRKRLAEKRINGSSAVGRGDGVEAGSGTRNGGRTRPNRWDRATTTRGMAQPVEQKKVYGGMAQTRVHDVAAKEVSETIEERMAKRQKLAAAVELDESDDESEENQDEILAPALLRPGMNKPESSSDDSDSEASEIQEDTAQKRRIALERARQAAAARAKEEEAEERAKAEAASGGAGAQLAIGGGASSSAAAKVLDDSSEESSADSDDSDDSEAAALAKPVFVPKGLRATEREKAAQVALEQELAQQQQILSEQRKQEAKHLVAARVAEEESLAVLADKVQHSESEYSLNSDEDETVEANEKIRELERVLELQKLRTARIEEFENLERRRNMTEAERLEDDERLDKLQPEAIEKQKFGFMQKYHHQGGYFMDKKTDGSEPLYRRDNNEPLASEKFDKSVLPKSMQVRRGWLGLKGQQKHKSLKESDTTDWTSAWVDPKVRERREKFAVRKADEERMRQEKIADLRKMGDR